LVVLEIAFKILYFS